MKKDTGNVTFIESVIVAVCILLFMFGVMGYTGVLGSGYHLIDDHEVYTMGSDFGKFGYWGTMYRWIANDLHIRFRFTYFLIRVTECYFLGDNFALWHGLQTVAAAAGLYLSYMFARRMKCTVWGASVFAIIIYIGGGQSAVWWRLGPQENWGIIIFMLTLLSLQSYLRNNKSGNMLLSVVLTIFLGGIKEAFLLLLPLLPVWAAYWEVNCDGQDISLHNICTSLKKRRIYCVATYLVFLVDMAVILLYVGTDRIEYAGIDAAYGILDFIRGIWNIVRGRLRLYVITTMIGVVFLLIPVCISWAKKQREVLFRFARYMIIPVLTFGYFLGVQFVLHVKSGMFERYLLPTTVAFAYFWLIDIHSFARHHRHFLRGYYVFVTSMALVLIMGSNDAEQAHVYAEDGVNTTALLRTAAEYADDSSNIIVGMGYEKDYSVSVYLQEKYHLKSVYNLYYSAAEGNVVHDGYLCDEDEKETITIKDAQIFIGYPHMMTPIMEEHGVFQQEFEIYSFGDYALYVAK